MLHINNYKHLKKIIKNKKISLQNAYNVLLLKLIYCVLLFFSVLFFYPVQLLSRAALSSGCSPEQAKQLPHISCRPRLP